MKKGHVIDQLILNELKAGRSTPTVIAKALDADKQYVWNRLKVLVLKGKIRQVAKGLYERC